jgi:hypothetical protein
MGGDKDFDDWIQSFEDECIVANHPESPDAKHRLYLEWLPLKLDTQALALDRQKTKVEYPDVKAERRTMLTDPHEAVNWTDKHQTAVETLRDVLTSNQVTHYPDFDKQFRIKADASQARKAKHTPYEEGDMIYMKVSKKERTKLQPKWAGPLEVKQQKGSPHRGPGTIYVCPKPNGSTCERNYEQLQGNCKATARHQQEKCWRPKQQRKTKMYWTWSQSSQ